MALKKAMKFIRVRGRVIPIALKNEKKMNAMGTVAGGIYGGASETKRQAESKKGGIASKVFSVFGSSLLGGIAGGFSASMASSGFNAARKLGKSKEILRRTKNFGKVRRFKSGKGTIKDLTEMDRDMGNLLNSLKPKKGQIFSERFRPKI